jgi:hypothetical protein
VPRGYGPWWRVYTLFSCWQLLGVWKRIEADLLAAADAVGKVDWQVSVDSTMETPTPITCDLTDAPDTAEERTAEYGRLFAQALIGRDCAPMPGPGCDSDHDIARFVVDDFYTLPDTIADGLAGMEDRLKQPGLEVTTNPSETVMHVHRAEAWTPGCFISSERPLWERMAAKGAHTRRSSDGRIDGSFGGRYE